MHIPIFGAGGQFWADALLFAAEAGQSVTPDGYLDGNPALWQACPLGLPVRCTLHAWRDITQDALFLGLGANRRRCELYAMPRAEGAHFAAFARADGRADEVIEIQAACYNAVAIINRRRCAGIREEE